MIKILKNNIFTKLLAFVLAIIAWFIIVNISNPMTNITIKNIPVKTINSHLLYTSDKSFAFDGNGSVDVQVLGRRTIVNRLTDTDFEAVADLKKLSLTNAVEVKISLKNPDNDVIILNDIKILNVRLENIVENPFPITTRAIGETKEGLAVGSIESNPPEVVIKGPESLIQNIKEIVAEIDVSNQAGDRTAISELKAYDIKGDIIKNDYLEISHSNVTVTAHISKIQNMPVRLINVPDMPSDKDYGISEIAVNPSNISIVSSKSGITPITSIDIPYDEKIFGAIKDSTISKSVQIEDYLPKGFKLISEQKKVSVQITVLPKIEKLVKIKKEQIKFINKNDGFSYEVIEPEISIKVIGTETIINKIKNEDYLATIDAKNLHVWTDNASLNVTALGVKGIEFANSNIKIKVTKE